MTFAAGQVLTAAQLNTHLRDNLLETEVAKATTSGGYFVSTGSHAIAERQLAQDFISTTDVTNSSFWADLSAIGPQVTVTTGSHAFIFMSCGMGTDTTSGQARAGYVIEGATTRTEPLDETTMVCDGITGASSNHCIFSQFDLIETLTPGENTFTMKYAASRVSPATAEFRYRTLAVLPL